MALQQALKSVPRTLFDGRTPQERENVASLATAILEEMSRQGIFTIPLADLPELWGRQMVQVQRSLPRACEPGFLAEVLIRGRVKAVTFVG